MKILLSELDKRLNVKIDKSIRADGVNGIMQFGENNDYPQRMERIISGSVTAKSAANAYAKFLSGDGFINSEINNITIGYDSRHKKITLRQLLSQVAVSLSFYNGAYIHINLDMMRNVVNAQHLLFKNCRFSKLDDTGYTAKLGYYENWEKEKNEKYDKAKVKWYNLFNLNEDVFVSQINKSKGIENFKGQVYFHFLDNQYIYPLSPFDSAYTDADTEYQMSLHKNNEIRNGFTEKTVFQVNEQLNEDAKGILTDGIKNFMGARGDKCLVIETETDENGNIIENKSLKTTSIKSNIDPKLYEGWEKEIANKIRKPLTIPSILIDYDEGKLGTTSGEGIIQATNFFNQITKDDRNSLSEMFKEVFGNFKNDVLKNNTNWGIKPLSLYEPSDIQPAASN